MKDLEKNKPRILLMTREIPYPPDKSGGTIVVYPILKYLSHDYDIDLFFPRLEKGEIDASALNKLRSYCKNIVTFPFRKNIFRSIMLILFHPLPLIYNAYSKRYFKKIIYPKIKDSLKDYHAILIQDSHLARFISSFNQLTSAKTIFLSTDYYTLLFCRMAKHSNHPLLKAYNFISYLKLKNSEVGIYQQFDRVMFVSDEDCRILENKFPEMHHKNVVIPNGLEIEKYQNLKPPEKEEENAIIFTGNMGYEPNRQAVMWFYCNVFKQLKRELKRIKWLIVGKDAGKYIKIDDQDVSISSSVPSLIPYIQNAALVISPLQSGTGLKNKVIEAMACRKIVIGSKISFDGIPITNCVHGVIASTPEDYVRELKKYLYNREERLQVEKDAFRFIENKFDMRHTVEKWKEVIA